MPTYTQAEKAKVIVKKPDPKRIVQMPAFGPLELGVTLDASSSMKYLRNAVIAGCNLLLSEQKPGSRFSANVFADSVKFLHRNAAIEEVLGLSLETYRPYGNTALLDGIGTIMKEIGNRFDKASGADRSRVLIAILTDGNENSSHMFGFDQVFHMIHQRRLMNWEFLFLTADAGGIAYGLKLGIKRSNIIEFQANPESITLLLERLSKAVGAYQLGDRNYTRLLLTDRQ